MMISCACSRRRDVYWDRVDEIAPLGEQPVFDATVAETHNFVANGITLENSPRARCGRRDLLVPRRGVQQGVARPRRGRRDRRQAPRRADRVRCGWCSAGSTPASTTPRRAGWPERRHPGPVFLGDDLLAWLILAVGGALFIGNVVAIARPPEQARAGRSRAGAARTITADGRHRAGRRRVGPGHARDVVAREGRAATARRAAYWTRANSRTGRNRETPRSRLSVTRRGRACPRRNCRRQDTRRTTLAVLGAVRGCRPVAMTMRYSSGQITPRRTHHSRLEHGRDSPKWTWQAPARPVSPISPRWSPADDAGAGRDRRVDVLGSGRGSSAPHRRR